MNKAEGKNKKVTGTTSHMLAIIDDAGDPGFKFERGSSQFFVIACIVFDDLAEAEAVASALRCFKAKRNWSTTYELKFNTLRKDIIKEVLSAILPYNFRIRSIVVDKPRVKNHEMRSKPGAFYNYVVKEVLARDDKLNNAKVRLDGRAGRKYKRQAAVYFRKAVNKQDYKIADFDFADSKRTDLVQLADLVVGSIYRSKQTSLTDCADYLAILRPKIDEMWDFE
jgi:hypothetical protein